MIDQLTYDTVMAIKKIAKSIRNLDVHDCNTGLTSRQETRRKNLIDKANKLAMKIDGRIYHQADPRGCSIYLVYPNQNNHEHYHEGIAIY